MYRKLCDVTKPFNKRMPLQYRKGKYGHAFRDLETEPSYKQT